MTNSTFYGNSAGSGGGGAGGAIYNDNASLTVTNSTFYGNSSQNGGGINLVGNNAILDIKGTILADSTGGNCLIGGGTTTDNGYNLSDDSSCDFSGTGSENSDTNIGLATALAQNGGPTETLAVNSVTETGGAYDLIPAPCTDQSDNTLTTDQRGVTRPQSGTCSAGAYQYVPPSLLISVTPTTLPFGSVAQGKKSAAKLVTVENTSASEAITIGPIEVSNSNFAETNNCPSSLTAGASCTIKVKFTPTTTGALTGILSINDNVPGSPQTVALSGTGEAAIVCNNASASNPGLVAVLPIYFPENVTGITDVVGPYTVSITGIQQSKPLPQSKKCSADAYVTGTTACLKTTTESSGRGNLLYSIGFTATDTTTAASCTGAVPVCVQDLLDSGNACTGTATYDAECP